MQPDHQKTFWNRRPLAGAVLLAAVVVLLGWWMAVPEGLLGKADAVGYAVCHRIDLRSFHLGTRPISFCARCTGMYLGALFGMAYLFVRRPRAGGYSPRRVTAVLVLLALPWVLDGLNSFTNLLPDFPSLYTTTNTIRLITGTALGVVMAAFVTPAFHQTVWKDWDEAAALASLRDLVPLGLLAALVVLAVLTEHPLVLYPAALLSALGVVALLSLVYAMLAMILLRMENRISSARELLAPLAIGFTLAMLQIAGSDLLRFWLTGTWEGFHFG